VSLSTRIETGDVPSVAKYACRSPIYFLSKKIMADDDAAAIVDYAWMGHEQFNRKLG
jgi:hypothetical protein